MVACTLVLASTGCSGSSGAPTAASASAGSTYTLMQMNLCLSGVAGCYAKVHYPAGIEDAVSRIREAHPDAVTFNEACSGDVALIARQTGYHVRFSTVIYYGKPLPCVRPGSPAARCATRAAAPARCATPSSARRRAATSWGSTPAS